ncbi:MAG TPA: PQQ-binding-like beta-propeller repeat protein, partial [Pyrinomonadaceae bacterium]|nr:PQQ-binding-like beta-propeller repeat protein [Pyrinomonadaceae bacterium]
MHKHQPSNRRWLARAALATCAVVALWAALLSPASPVRRAPGTTRKATPVAQGDKQPAQPKQVQIDLDRAVAVKLPTLAHDLRPVAFKTSDGKEGWALRIPGERPIATPAYAAGLIFVGGGYGSNEFYAFDARTGALRWKMHTSDDGPTAAVAEGGYVAFNTESCTVIVVNAQTGKVVWQEWLGDPL